MTLYSEQQTDIFHPIAINPLKINFKFARNSAWSPTPTQTRTCVLFVILKNYYIHKCTVCMKFYRKHG